MNGLNNDNYLVKFVVKWIAAIIHWCWRQDKMNYYIVFFWHCPQSNFKNVSENLCLFKSDNGSSKAGKGWFVHTNICIREGEFCCWFMAASTLAGEAAGLENSPKLWDLGLEFCRAEGGIPELLLPRFCVPSASPAPPAHRSQSLSWAMDKEVTECRQGRLCWKSQLPALSAC